MMRMMMEEDDAELDDQYVFHDDDFEDDGAVHGDENIIDYLLVFGLLRPRTVLPARGSCGIIM